jgi:CTP:molybdopterin cytidylyltransferase MocA
VRSAARWAAEGDWDGLLLALCDQPYLSAQHVDALIEEFRAYGVPVGSAYGGIVGAPAVFGCAHLKGLLALRGDRGAGALLRTGARAVPWPDGAADIDTEDDLGHAKARRFPASREA